MRSLDWKATTFVAVVGGLKLFGLLAGAVKPHLNEAAALGLGVNLTAASVMAPTPEIRRCGGGGLGGGKTGDPGTQLTPRIKLSNERREGNPSSFVTLQVTSSSR